MSHPLNILFKFLSNWVIFIKIRKCVRHDYQWNLFHLTKFYFFYPTVLSVEVVVINDGNSLRYVRFQNIEIRMIISKLCSDAQDKMRICTCLLEIYPFAKKKKKKT